MTLGEVSSWQDYSRFLVGLFAILDPFIAVPLFLSLTANRSDAERARTVNVVTMTVLAVLAGAAVAGEALLQLIGGSLASFRVGGGLVLLLMALAMLNARTGDVRQTAQEADELEQSDGRGVVPLAIPLLAGPGAISTVIVAAHGDGLLHRLIVILCVVLACALLWITLRLAAPVGKRLGTTGLNIVNRLLGLLLAAFAVESMASGLRALFPALG
ncbi:MAG: NAAT family transporter [Burkholderiales bacterium]|nr:NAAT family transporter [Burkholderiales bacterium]